MDIVNTIGWLTIMAAAVGAFLYYISKRDSEERPQEA
jgi:hypothetical protein